MPRMLLFRVIAICAGLAGPGAADEAPFWAGIAAYRAADTDSAAALLGHPVDNPYLEAFRLYYRAECLAGDTLFREAASEIETLFALERDGRIAGAHRILDRAKDLYVEALAGCGECISSRGTVLSSLDSSEVTALAGRSSFVASRACLDRENAVEGLAHFVAGLRARPSSKDSSLMSELFARLESRLPELSRRELLDVASGAAALGCRTEAREAVGQVLARDSSDADALLVEASIVHASGEHERALHRYWRIYESSAPVSAKSAALREIASIEYRLRRYGKAAEHYRMFGMYYPQSESAPPALDTAARIHVLQREWVPALRVWKTLRESFPRTASAREAALSEAALRSWLGEDSAAHGVVLSSAGGAGPSAASLYWLMRTSVSSEDRATWSDSLARTFPNSFYAAMAANEEEFLASMGNAEAAGREAGSLALLRAKRMATYGAVAPDSVLASHAAFRAYVGFLEHACAEEAEITVRSLLDTPSVMRARRTGGDARTSGAAREIVPERLSALYGEAMRHGADALALTLLTYAAPTDSTGAFPSELRYPLSYIEEIAARAESISVSPLLVLALIREESRFDPKVVSRADARGLMQILPRTAAWLARRTDSLVLAPETLFDPVVNVGAGIRYLDYLRGRFNGSFVGALAAYNGGEGKMARWSESFEPGKNPMVAIELIGPQETRNYVKKVLESYGVYRALARVKAGGE